MTQEIGPGILLLPEARVVRWRMRREEARATSEDMYRVNVFSISQSRLPKIKTINARENFFHIFLKIISIPFLKIILRRYH